METGQTLIRFVGHVLAGLAMSLLLAATAFVMSLIGNWLDAHHVAPMITSVFRLLEYFLYSLDTVLIVVFSLREAYVWLAKLFR